MSGEMGSCRLEESAGREGLPETGESAESVREALKRGPQSVYAYERAGHTPYPQVLDKAGGTQHGIGEVLEQIPLEVDILHQEGQLGHPTHEDGRQRGFRQVIGGGGHSLPPAPRGLGSVADIYLLQLLEGFLSHCGAQELLDDEVPSREQRCSVFCADHELGLPLTSPSPFTMRPLFHGQAIQIFLLPLDITHGEALPASHHHTPTNMTGKRVSSCLLGVCSVVLFARLEFGSGPVIQQNFLA